MSKVSAWIRWPWGFVLVLLVPLAWTAVYLNLKEPEPEPGFVSRCDRATIEWNGLQACASHSECDLTDNETLDLLRARKEAIVYCSAAAAQRALREAKTDRDVQSSPMTEERGQEWSSIDQTS